MALRPVQVNIKAVDHAAVGRFWAAALGWGVVGGEAGGTSYAGPGDGLGWPPAVGVGIDVVGVPEAKSAVKNRAHLDLASTSGQHQRELVARLRDLGATPADVGQGDVPWTVLADPEGNEFCVLEPREVYRDTGPIAAVVVDCADPRAMARFWGGASDWAVHEVADTHASLRSAAGVGPYLEFLRKAGGKTVPDRVHLDLLPYPGDDKEAEVARLKALGAADLDVGQGDVPWTCLVDPEGHEFCVLALP
ncbi:VOC family protein [Actinacidiphila bryophytorum]|uniref:Glyoxalase n=1 Tax=Actinacidiphila bryophytorum TaxID=1436133 RepID=A0A9W4GZJ1_9ACTN|nr:VOC family protein [Actinacidiphila bryophytorum]MBM9434789.1 VOC family protein [Actinacidiphila bryophytorum]MBN6543539.1 VOC family protein [Actinacidiphila bryophytorum]CAG7630205.1 Glyoxalase [Actinacidiphila bryophytorum]